MRLGKPVDSGICSRKHKVLCRVTTIQSLNIYQHKSIAISKYNKILIYLNIQFCKSHSLKDKPDFHYQEAINQYLHVCLHTETFVWHQSSCISEILQTADVSSNVCSIFLVPMSCTIYGFHHKFLVAVIIQSSLLNGPLLVASSNKTLNPSSSVLAALLAQFSCTCLSMVYRIFFLSVGQKNKNTSYSLSTRHFFDKKHKGSHQEVANCSHKKLNATTSTLN